MTQKQWRTRIIKAMKEIGTYQKSFDDPINTLADILESRDRAKAQFEALGGHTIIKHTNKGGATNLEQNPALRLMNDLNRDALAFWRDLGLTPKGLKSITDIEIKEKKEDPLDEVLKKLGR